MKTFSYRKLADGEASFDNWLNKLKIDVNKNDRLHNVYKIVGKFADIFEKTDIETSLKKFLAQYKNGEPLQALLDAQEFKHMLNFFPEIDPSILKQKLEFLIRGTLIRGDEDSLNPISRNTQYELVLFSQIRRAGYKAILCDPRPDILARTNGREYFIECKRLLVPTVNSINKNTKVALRQLNQEMSSSNNNQYGVVAISVQRVFSRPNEILNSPDPFAGLAFIQELSKDFINQNNYIWQNEARLKNSRISSVWVHYSGGVRTKKSPFISGVFNTTMTNAWRDSRNFNVVEEDFRDMEKKLTAFLD